MSCHVTTYVLICAIVNVLLGADVRAQCAFLVLLTGTIENLYSPHNSDSSNDKINIAVHFYIYLEQINDDDDDDNDDDDDRSTHLTRFF